MVHLAMAEDCVAALLEQLREGHPVLASRPGGRRQPRLSEVVCGKLGGWVGNRWQRHTARGLERALKKFQVRVLSGSLPVMKLLREAEQMAKFVNARSKVRALAENLSSAGVFMKDCPYAALSCGLRSSDTSQSTFFRAA